MEKPVIILGGGLMGSLLAYRLKTVLPGVPFLLYEESSTLGNHQTCSFRESDCPESMRWLSPLVTYSWKHHQVKFPKFEKWITNPYHLIDPRHLHRVVSEKLGECLKLNNKIALEQALKESSFVIDARNNCHFKNSGYRKYLSLEIELQEEHNLIAPVIFDASVGRTEHFRNLYYLPLGARHLMVKDSWYARDKNLNVEEMSKTLSQTIKQKGWKISKVLREESGVTEVPLSRPIVHQEGRVVNVAGIFHDITGCSIPATTKLINRMINTSFRFGELREVVQSFRNEIDTNRKFFRYLNRQLIHHKRASIFENIYSQPYPVLERFSRGQLNFMDRSRIALGEKTTSMGHFLNILRPYSLYPKVEGTHCV